MIAAFVKPGRYCYVPVNSKNPVSRPQHVLFAFKGLNFHSVPLAIGTCRYLCSEHSFQFIYLLLKVIILLLSSCTALTSGTTKSEYLMPYGSLSFCGLYTPLKS